MASIFIYLCFSLFFLSLPSIIFAGEIGINYGRIANNLPDPKKVVTLLKSQGFSRVKMYDTDPDVLSAFSGSGISLTVALPNENLSAAANSQSFTDNWVKSRIIPFIPASNITAIAVGNEVNTDDSLVSLLVLAMKNLYSSLQKFSISSVSLSSPVSLTVLENSYPTSSGSFKTNLVTTTIKPMLDFIKKSNSFLMVNIYPFFAYSANSDKISLDYSLFKPNSGVVDSGNGLKYNSLFEAQIDAVYAALDKLNYNDIKLVVTETGWPSKGDENEIGASGPNAAGYNGNLIKRVLNGGGTPLRPNNPLDVYLFALFNENQKPGPTSERNYGLFYPNEQPVYALSGGTAVAPTVAEGGGDVAPSVDEGGSKVVVGETWCVANEHVGDEKLQSGLDYACGEGGANCRPIQPDATCYNPNSLVAHASYAFNSYYQMKARASGTCDFGGAAHVVTQPPQFGECKFPTGY